MMFTLSSLSLFRMSTMISMVLSRSLLFISCPSFV
nr:MAG TPA: hypothetical protein [Caudoviricetes sp.]